MRCAHGPFLRVSSVSFVLDIRRTCTWADSRSRNVRLAQESGDAAAGYDAPSGRAPRLWTTGGAFAGNALVVVRSFGSKMFHDHEPPPLSVVLCPLSKTSRSQREFSALPALWSLMPLIPLSTWMRCRLARPHPTPMRLVGLLRNEISLRTEVHVVSTFRSRI